MAKISHSTTIVNGKTYKVGSSSPQSLSASMTNGLTSAGIGINFSQKNLMDTFQSMNISMKAGDDLKYSIALKSYKIIEIAIEHKVTVRGTEMYQGIILRIEKLPGQSVRLPMVIADAGSVVEKDSLLCIIGAIGVLAIGGAAIGPAVSGAGAIIDFFFGGIGVVYA